MLENQYTRRWMEDFMADCRLCPRNCHVNRLQGETGYCGQNAGIRAARAALHFWEEPCISGENGSGAVFFSGCALGCVYCQNRQISNSSVGEQISEERLAEIFLALQDQKALNINLVTAGHFVPQTVLALQIAKNQGLQIPIVYNSSGYEKVETLRMLDGLVDIYLPDLKYVSSDCSEKYSAAPDYPQIAKAAIAEMVRQTGKPGFSGEQMTQGVIVRHLVLPGQVNAARETVRWLYETYREKIYISILNQYTPVPGMEKWPQLNRKVTTEEYDAVVDYAIDIGVEQGFIQEGETAEESFIPAFDLTGLI